MTDESLQHGEEPSYVQPKQLFGGINFSTWPDLKWSRGSTHAALLQARFGEWQASAPVSIEVVLRDDRQGLDLVSRVPKGIPQHDWSLDLGDSIHNLRSAFDAVAWGMAHFDGAAPARPRRVAFPICQDEKQWNAVMRDWVGELDPEFQQRIRILQPFALGHSGEASVLRMLHELDVQDKHRDIVRVSADLSGISLGGSFEYEDHNTSATPRVEMKSGTKFGDSVLLGTIHGGATIRTVGETHIRPAIKVELEHGDSSYDLIPTLHYLVQETRRYLDILLSGVASSEDEETGWRPLEVEESED